MAGQKNTAVPSDALYLASEKQAEALLQEVENTSYRSELTVSRYLAPFKRYPALSDALEIDAIFERYHYGRTERERQRAFDELLCGNILLVVKYSYAYRGRGMPILDLIQEGVLGLKTAIEKYSPDDEWAFSTFAVWWIKQGMRREILNQFYGRSMRQPVHVREAVLLLLKAETLFLNKHGHVPSDEELFTQLKSIPSIGAGKMTLSRMKDLRTLLTQRDLSFDQSFSRDASDERTFGDTIADPQPSAEKVVEAQQLLEAYRKFAEQAEPYLREFSHRDAEIMRHRLGLRRVEPITLQTLGERFGLSRERIRQIEVKALKKLSAKFGLAQSEISNVFTTIEALETFLSSR